MKNTSKKNRRSASYSNAEAKGIQKLDGKAMKGIRGGSIIVEDIIVG